MNKFVQSLVLILLLAASLSACQGQAAQTVAPEQAAAPAETEAQPTVEPTEIIPTETSAPTATLEPTPEPPTATPEPTLVPTETVPPGLPAEPQEIAFQAEDGQLLMGRYYPAAFEGAPLIVMMHWAGGDRNDWNEIAFWLQNRGLSGSSPNVGSAPWLNPAWFPPVPEGKSYAVFSFSFRGYEDDARGGPPEWLLDAQAGMKAARDLPAVDPEKVVALGASIGADGAPDGCFWNNDTFGSGCLGALSLSPGSYLTVPYDQAVENLMTEQPPKPVWCFYSTDDAASATACKSATGDQYQVFEWTGQFHGMMLLQPEVDPSAMQLILDWLAFLGL